MVGISGSVEVSRGIFVKELKILIDMDLLPLMLIENCFNEAKSNIHVLTMYSCSIIYSVISTTLFSSFIFFSCFKEPVVDCR